MSAEEKLFALACQDMPVSPEEVRTVMRDFVYELAQRQRDFADQEDAHLGSTAAAAYVQGIRDGYVQGIRDGANLIDPKAGDHG
ncbi:hypothetical protein [Streptomyces sp. NPDC017448]|uniref:hypothetical protein n=1 Tax=Streptomyces sp. NPDC017448 TaxID=3364996 RepID=UPI0037AD94B1